MSRYVETPTFFRVEFKGLSRPLRKKLDLGSDRVPGTIMEARRTLIRREGTFIVRTTATAKIGDRTVSQDMHDHDVQMGPREVEGLHGKRTLGYSYVVRERRA